MEGYMGHSGKNGAEKEDRRGRRMRKGRGKGKWVLFLGGLAICVALGIWALIPPEPVTFQYRDRVLQALEGVAVNDLELEGFYQDERGRVQYAWEGDQARSGIDVSFYQGEIDWAAVAADGVEFAFIRLGYRGYTEGGLQLDSCFEANIKGALEAGLEVGVYFFSQALTVQEAEEEARFVLQTLAPYRVTYPVVFDWEFITPGKGARTDQMDGQTLTQCARAFCNEVAGAGYEPMVYFNQDMGYLTYDLSKLEGLPLWLAEYDTKPDFFYQFHFWQYTHTGTVAGIQGNVDWNLDLRPCLGEE